MTMNGHSLMLGNDERGNPTIWILPSSVKDLAFANLKALGSIPLEESSVYAANKFHTRTKWLCGAHGFQWCQTNTNL